MTDKQIIKNGIDVSGCDFYDKNKKYCLTLKMNPTGFKNPSCFSGDFQKCIQDSKTCPNTFCDNNPNCYYKNWKRKEQECEELKKDNKELQYQLRCTTGREKEWERNCKFWDARCEKLQTELDQLKTENEELNKYIKHLHNLCGNETDKQYKYKQTLTEIKQLLEDALDPDKTSAEQSFDNFYKTIELYEVLDE